MSDDIIKTGNLTKIYKLKGGKNEIRALNNINLSIKDGEIFGLLGPNGAGKTTFIQILTTIMQPTLGYAEVNGYNVVTQPKKVKSLIGLMLESEMLYYRITGYDNLKFFCKIYKVHNFKEKIKKITEEFGIHKWLNEYVNQYSSGMKMKLALCRTLLIDRQILLLDEPTLGLDVKSIDLIIRKLKSLKKTIFLTSHDMSVVEKLCDRIAFINHGDILKVGGKREIKRLMQTQIQVNIEIKEQHNQLKKELINHNFIEEITENNYGLTVVLKSRDFYNDLLLILSNFPILRVNEPELSLEDLFLRLIQ
jgi:ABC-2 type transport system ATP-binding protein